MIKLAKVKHPAAHCSNGQDSIYLDPPKSLCPIAFLVRPLIILIDKPNPPVMDTEFFPRSDISQRVVPHAHPHQVSLPANILPPHGMVEDGPESQYDRLCGGLLAGANVLNRPVAASVLWISPTGFLTVLADDVKILCIMI